MLNFIHPTMEKMWKSLFKVEEEEPFPEEGTDRDLSEEVGGDQVRIAIASISA